MQTIMRAEKERGTLMKQWFQNLGYKFQEFMRGRYGDDNLNRFMIVIALIIIVIDMFVSNSIAATILNLVSWALIIFIFFRMFSKNLPARQAENERYMKITSRFRKSGNANTGNSSYTPPYNSSNASTTESKSARARRRAENAAEYRKDNKVFKCRKCGQMLRVPKGKGKVKVTCPKCGESFIKRT